MRAAVSALVGEEAARGLSSNVVSRLKRSWDEEYQSWCRRSLADDWVYVWEDGIHSGLRGAGERLCVLVVIGVNARGEKHFLAIEDGVRESTQSWREVLLGMKQRGFTRPAKLAIGDGALGFWSAGGGGDGCTLDRPVAGKVRACRDLLERVVDQTRRRVFGGETVPAQEKVVSLFEPHTDIIVKGGRGTHYGHKVNFAIGRSGLALDAVVEDGNPADSARCLPMLARHVEHYGAAPTHAAFDGGYASRENLKQAKALGVTHAVFHKKRGMKVADMTPSAWLYRQLKRFRAGVEAGISYLKRCFRLGLCRWRGLPRFKAYVQSAVFAHNLMRLARLRPQPG